MKRSKLTNSAIKLPAVKLQPKHPVQSLRQLREFQRFMTSALFRPLTVSDRMQKKWIDGRSMHQVTSEIIKPNDRLTSFDRLEIYNRQYWFRVLDCMYQDFPGLKSVIGNTKFHKLATRYLEKYPSRSFTLRNLGSRIEGFLREEPSWTQPHQELALDVARFEWAQIVAFDGEAKAVLTLKEIGKIKPAQLKLKLQPYLSILEFDYPVEDYLISVKKTESLRAEASNAVGKRKESKFKNASLPQEEKVYLAIHRLENSLFYKRLDPRAFQILKSLQKGRSLSKSCEPIFSDTKANIEDLSVQVQKWFQNWASLGWFCRD
jgi:hypothetical protein